MSAGCKSSEEGKRPKDLKYLSALRAMRTGDIERTLFAKRRRRHRVIARLAILSCLTGALCQGGAPASAQTGSPTPPSGTQQLPGTPAPNKTPPRQTPKPGQVDPGAIAPPLPVVKLSVSPNSGKVGDTFTYTLAPANPSLGRAFSFIARVRYRFVFDDGTATEWNNLLREEHKYAAPGAHAAYAEVAFASANGNSKSGRSNTVRVVVKPADDNGQGTASPSPTPSAAVSPSPVNSPTSSPSASPTASASLSPTPNTSPSPSATASPSAAASPGSSSSPPPTDSGQTSGATPTPDNALPDRGPDSVLKRAKWPLLLLVVLLALVVGYRIARWIFPARPRLVPCPDPDAKFNDDREPLAIEFQLLLNSNIPSGEYKFQPDDPTLIASVRREND